MNTDGDGLLLMLAEHEVTRAATRVRELEDALVTSRLLLIRSQDWLQRMRDMDTPVEDKETR